jgi:hypothetical protein
MLMVNSKDIEGVQALMTELGCPEETSLDQLRTQSLLAARDTWKQTVSNLSKLLRKQWPFLEHLIVEKTRRKSSVIKSEDESINSSQSTPKKDLDQVEEEGDDIIN